MGQCPTFDLWCPTFNFNSTIIYFIICCFLFGIILDLGISEKLWSMIKYSYSFLVSMTSLSQGETLTFLGSDAHSFGWFFFQIWSIVICVKIRDRYYLCTIIYVPKISVTRSISLVFSEHCCFRNVFSGNYWFTTV